MAQMLEGKQTTFWLFLRPFDEMEPIPDNSNVVKNWKLVRSQAIEEKSTTIILFNEQAANDS